MVRYKTCLTLTPNLLRFDMVVSCGSRDTLEPTGPHTPQTKPRYINFVTRRYSFFNSRHSKVSLSYRPFFTSLQIQNLKYEYILDSRRLWTFTHKSNENNEHILIM